MRDEGNRPSTFFIVAILAALVLLVGAFIGFVSKTPGARPASTTTWIPGAPDVAQAILPARGA